MKSVSHAVPSTGERTHFGKWGNSHALRFKDVWLRIAQLDPNDLLDVIIGAGSITIRKAETPKSRLMKRLEGCKPMKELDWGEDVGAEIVED